MTATAYRAELPERPLSRLDGPNARLHWRRRGQRAHVWRTGVHVVCRVAGFPFPLEGDGWVVTITIRAARGVEPDQDNLRGMLKPVVDGIADALGRTDSPRDGVEWRYEYARGPDAVIIELSKEV